MTFYQMIQYDPASIRAMIAKTDAPEEKRRWRLAMFVRSLLIVVFAIAFIGLMTALFGSANSSMAVSIFCILLASRFVGFGYRIKDSLFAMFVAFALLFGAPILASLSPSPLLTFVIHFCALLLIIALTCENPSLGNGGLYSFAYIFLCGNPVYGQDLIGRLEMTVVGYVLCAIVLWRNHRNANPDRTLGMVFHEFTLYNYKCQWQLRLTLGVSLLLTIFSLFVVPRYMWAGFACGSLLSDAQIENRIHEKKRDRILGVIAGSLLFYVVYKILPPQLYPLLGPVGGLCLGMCSEYRHKTMLNCFGALSLAAGLYGLKDAVILRIGLTIAGVLFAMLFYWLYDRFIMVHFLPETQKRTMNRAQNQ